MIRCVSRSAPTTAQKVINHQRQCKSTILGTVNFWNGSTKIEKPLNNVHQDSQRLFNSWMGLMGGLTVVGLCHNNTVHASDDEGAITLGFSANGPCLPRDPGTLGNLVTQLRGHVVLYPQTGKVNFIYHLDVDLYVNQKKLTSCEKPVAILFKLLNENGHILEIFNNTYVLAGDRDFVFSTSKEILLKTKKIVAVLSYV